MEFLIITGLSGSGKSTAINILEDIGYYCVDNLPPELIPRIYDLCTLGSNGGQQVSRVAVVTDTRGGFLFNNLQKILKQMDKASCSYKLVFLDSADATLVQRYKETRRRHPLLEDAVTTISETVARERMLLQPFRAKADFLIDTTFLTRGQLKEKMCDIFLQDSDTAMSVQCMSFGFKYGLPHEADIVLDVRCLPNPYYVPELKPLTGIDEPIREYLLQYDTTLILQKKFFDMIDFLLPLYLSEGKSQLVVAFGCTGGKHRSVMIAQSLFERLEERKLPVGVIHRDIKKH